VMSKVVSTEISLPVRIRGTAVAREVSVRNLLHTTPTAGTVR
jgi:hypothetical protein